MRNYKVMIDMSDNFLEINKFRIREFDAPFLIIFIQASDPDEVCYELVQRLINKILEKDDSIQTRILCRKIKRTFRFDRIQPL